MILVLCGALLANVAVNVSVLIQQAPLGTDRLYAANETVIRTVQEAGYTKGYATFWNANINTLPLGPRGAFPATHVSTADGRREVRLPLSTRRTSTWPPMSTFLYVAPNAVPLVHQGLPHELDVQWWINALGAPAETQDLPNGGTLLFYDRDIGSDLPLRVPIVED